MLAATYILYSLARFKQYNQQNNITKYLWMNINVTNAHEEGVANRAKQTQERN